MPETEITTSTRGRRSCASGMRRAPLSRPTLSKRGTAPMSASACASGVPSDFMLSDPQSTTATDSGYAPLSSRNRRRSNSALAFPSSTAAALGTR